jgi:hypothetical protein
MLDFLHSTPPERIDLSEDSRFFLELLDSTHVWRERLVRELRFGNRNHVRAISSYQIDFPPALLEKHGQASEARTANILIPLTTRPKGPLLNFSLSGPGGSPATLTSRASIAALQAEYLGALAESSAVSGILCSRIDSQLFESICVFTPGFFNDSFFRDGNGDIAVALAEYLTSGLDLPVGVEDVRRWRRKTAQAGAILAERLREPPDPLSSSEEVLLALPHNPRLPASIDEIGSLVDGYHEAILAADEAADEQFLVALAEYGRRYEVVIEVEVPLLEPSRVKIEEDLPLRVKHRGLRSWVGQEFPLGDARSTHLEARSDDPNVEAIDYQIQDLHGRDASGWLESIRLTREALSLYGSEPGRPYFAVLWLRLGVARSLRIGAWLLLVANLVAIVAVPFIGFSGSVGDRLAVLAIPTTIAATFALVREQTALAARLQWIPRMLLAATTVALWLEVVIGLIAFDDSSTRTSVSRPEHAAEWSYKTTAPSTMHNGEGVEGGEERSKRKRPDRRSEGP